ncbi:MAG: hypothetical protein Q9171_001707 [Xanthocarpia ochracea]
MSESPPAFDDVDPPWGSLATEKYLLQRWNPDSSESPDQQRKRLIREYIKAGPERPALIASSSTEGPTAAQISSILEPWRTLDQREIARAGSIATVWLRTCYSEGTDEKHDEIVENIDMQLAVDGEDQLLNDPDLYDFGANWQQVFDVLPELLEPQEGNWDVMKESQRQAMEALVAFAEGGVSRAPSDLLKNLSSYQGKELEDAVADFLQSEAHAAQVHGFMVLEDEEALNSGRPILIFLDVLGRVVRSQRVENGDEANIMGSWEMCSWHEISQWEDAELGEDYKIGGACEGLLLEKLKQT